MAGDVVLRQGVASALQAVTTVQPMRLALAFDEQAIAAIRTCLPSAGELTSLPIFLNVGRPLLACVMARVMACVMARAKAGLKGIPANGGFDGCRAPLIPSV